VRGTVLERLLALSEINDLGCRVWHGSTDSGGYGKIRVGSKTVGAHRVAYAIENGAIPGGKAVRHKCDTPLCVNAKHMELGTQLDNMLDKVKRGRCPSGERHPNARLTFDQVLNIRRRAALETFAALAREHNVTPSHVRNIVLGLKWAKR